MRRPSSALDGLVREGDSVLVLGLEELGEDAWTVLAASGLRLLRVARPPRRSSGRRWRRSDRGDRRAAGPALIAAVRARPELAGVHVVVCADLDSPHELREALDSGADDVMRIPFEPQVLAVRVATGLRAARLRANEALLRSLVDNIPGAVYRCACDEDWTMEWLSDEIEEITGYPASRLHRQRGAHVREHRASRRSRVRGAVGHGSVATGRPFALEYRLLRRDGSVRWVLERGQAQESGDGRWWLDGAIFDITARRAAEQALREHEVIEAQLAEVRASRARILDAADRARRDIERNLHDGAQQRLVSVALELQHLAGEAPRPARRRSRAPVREALEELRAGLAELRDLARGLHPAVLSDHGLEHALRALAQRAAVPVELETALPEERLPMAVEAAAYFAVSEALTNVARYAAGSQATVRVERARRATRRHGRRRRRRRGGPRRRLGPAGPARPARRPQRDARDRQPAGARNAAAGATSLPRGERAQDVGGRRSAHGRAASNCAASDSSVASSLGRPTIWTASGRPVRGEAGGNRRGGLAGRVPEHVERHPPGRPQVGDGRAATLHQSRRHGRLGHHRGQQDVVFDEEPPDALGHAPLCRQQSVARAVGDEHPGTRVAPGCGAPAAPGRSTSPTKSWIARNSRPRITGTSRARKSISCSTTVCPSPRRTSTVRSSAPRTSGVRRPRTPAGNAEETAIRSAPGCDRAASANGRAGSGSARVVAGHRPAQRVEHDGRVDHRARQRPEHDPVAAVAVVRRPRHATALRLEPEQAGARRRDADRARAVHAERGRHHAGRHRCRGAAAGPARRALDVPRVARHAPGHRLRERPQAQLRHRRLADHHRAGRPQPPHDLRIVGGAGRERARARGWSPRPRDRSRP